MSAPPLQASTRTRRLLGWLCALVWLGAFAATHAPPGDVPNVGPSDKVLHFAGYAALATPLMLLLAARGRPGRHRAAITIGVLLAYAALDELTQPIVGRDADILDWLCDIAGAATSVVVWEIIFAVRRRRRAEANRSEP